ncbi:restriction endonuclease subunit S, partial [Pediococcus pentosaceus]
MENEDKNRVPKLRYPGYTDPWVQRSFLENIKSIIDFRGKAPKKLGMTWSKTGYLALSARNVKNGYIDTNVDAHYGNQELYDKWMIDKELHKNQVLFTTEAPMGNIAQIPDERKYILSQRTMAFNVNSEKITEDFLATLLRSPKTFYKLKTLTSGGTAKGISQNSLTGLKIVVPKSLEEQQSVASLFKKLDDLIALQQRKIEHLRKRKAGLLQKMFPKDGADVPEVRFPEYTDAWVLRKLNDIGNTYNSLSGKSKEDFNHGDAHYVTYLNVFNNPVSSKNGIEKIEIDSKQQQVKYGDIFFTTSSETPEEVGMSSVWIYNIPNTYLNSFCFGYRLNVKYNLFFLSYVFRNIYF